MRPNPSELILCTKAAFDECRQLRKPSLSQLC
jgi:hypothetical protein